jgi:Tfp pilus assembly protein PilX
MSVARILRPQIRFSWSIPFTPAQEQHGIALIASLFALSILTLIGMTMMFVSSTDTLINRNNKMQLVTLYAAESATEEARDRLNSFLTSGLLSLADPDKVVYITASSSISPTTGDTTSNPYFDRDYSASFSTTVVPSEVGDAEFAWVKLTQKSEQRAGYDLNGSGKLETAPVFFGYDRFQPDARPSQYVNSGTNPTTHTGNPVYQITALARDASGFEQIVRSDVSLIPQPPLTAALFSKDAITVSADTVTVQGKDEDPGAVKDLNGLESNSLISGSTTNVQGTPLSSSSNSMFSYNIDALIKTMKPPLFRDIEKVAPNISKIPGGGYLGTGLTIGQIPTAGDTSQCVFADGPLTLSDSSGQGILVVNGDFTVTGSFTYYGLIVVKGRVDLNGSGVPGIEIHGAIISGTTLGDQSTVLSGNLTIINNSYFVQKQFGSLPYARLSYREILR